CELERPQAGGGGSEADLSSGHGGAGPTASGGVRDQVGLALSEHREDVAAALGRHQPVVRVPGRDPAGDLHDERGGVAAHDAAQGDQDAGLVSQRGVGTEAAVSGVEKYRTTLEGVAGLADISEPLHATVRRSRRSGPGPAVAVNRPGSAPPALRPVCSAWACLPAAGWGWGTASYTKFKTLPRTVHSRSDIHASRNRHTRVVARQRDTDRIQCGPAQSDRT